MNVVWWPAVSYGAELGSSAPGGGGGSVVLCVCTPSWL